MPRSPQPAAPPYLIEEPTTGLYLVQTSDGPRLARAAEATRFATAADAVLAVQGTPVASQAHELVRVAA